ncbi:hypothetical protein F0562_028981 [Nyssa sinensis]|uniref:Bet v I/Major latex protein domain-containing protein n=1 Tax=Nyssa sinensis TaxID=561372 RepID=A0A5J5AZN8_9ASTE|nr:hypothetical protein F0562_028981 [Nyssa sinensis]
MAVTSITQEFTTPIAPARMFKALILDSHNLVPKLMPQSIKSVEFVEGDGGVGSIKQTNFTDGSHFKYLKHRIDTLDKDNCVNGGCFCKMTSEYHAKAGVELKEEEIKEGKDKAMAVYKHCASSLDNKKFLLSDGPFNFLFDSMKLSNRWSWAYSPKFALLEDSVWIRNLKNGFVGLIRFEYIQLLWEILGWD